VFLIELYEHCLTYVYLLFHAGLIMRTSIPFFKFIRCLFGHYTIKLLNSYIYMIRTSVLLRIRILFLRTCIGQELVPPHLNFIVTRHHLDFFQRDSLYKLKRINKRYCDSVLRIELCDVYKRLHETRAQMFKLFKQISNILPIRKKFLRTSRTD